MILMTWRRMRRRMKERMRSKYFFHSPHKRFTCIYTTLGSHIQTRILKIDLVNYYLHEQPRCTCICHMTTAHIEDIHAAAAATKSLNKQLHDKLFLFQVQLTQTVGRPVGISAGLLLSHDHPQARAPSPDRRINRTQVPVDLAWLQPPGQYNPSPHLQFQPGVSGSQPYTGIPKSETGNSLAS